MSSSPSPPLLSCPQETVVSKSPKSPSLASSSSRSSKASSRASSRRGSSRGVMSSYSPGVWPPSPFDVIITSVSETGLVYGQPLNCGKFLYLYSFNAIVICPFISIKFIYRFTVAPWFCPFKLYYVTILSYCYYMITLDKCLMIYSLLPKNFRTNCFYTTILSSKST